MPALGAIGVLLSLGRYAIVYALVAELPGVSGFRAPARHIILLHFAAAGLIGLAVDDLLRLARQHGNEERPPLWPLAVPVAVSVLCAIAGLAIARGAGPAAHFPAAGC